MRLGACILKRFDKVERFLQVNLHDVGMHVALKYTDMENMVSKKKASSPFCNILGLKQEKMVSHPLMIISCIMKFGQDNIVIVNF